MEKAVNLNCVTGIIWSKEFEGDEREKVALLERE